jgi:2',3'-cyclic-nucleotide 2'-phosphodiesterase (5'-nucleotidase family)
MNPFDHLQLVPADANPNGSFDALYVLADERTAGRAAAGQPFHARADCVDGRAARTHRLRIFHFNDLHNALQARSAGSTPAPLFSRIVHRYRHARATAGDDEVVLLLSGGDDHTGTPFDELLGWTRDEFVLDPAYTAYSAAGVDAATLGNHDLDRGGALLAIGIERCASFPILSANVGGSRTLVAGRHYVPAAIGIGKELAIGMIGLTTPVDTRVATTSDPHLFVSSPLAALRALLPRIAAHADIVILMSHCGYGVDSRDARPAFGAGYLPEGDIAIARLAASLTERPVVVLGAHSHTVLNRDGFVPETLIDGVPIVQAGGHGSHLGEFTATLQHAATRRDWSIAAQLHPLAGSPRGGGTPDQAPAAVDDADSGFERDVIAPMLVRVRRRTEEVLASVDGDADLSRETTLRLRYCGECALINLICDALAARAAEFPHGAVDLAIVNATAIADGLPPASAITFNDWYRVQPFADTLQVGVISARQLLGILRSNAQRIVRTEELNGAAAVDTSGYVSRGFLHFSSALRYTLRLAGSAREATVADATLNGVPVKDDGAPTIRIALTNYLGAGGYAESWNGSPIGAGVPGFLPGFDLRGVAREDTGLVFRNEVMAYVRAVGRIGRATGARLDGRLAVV